MQRLTPHVVLLNRLAGLAAVLLTWTTCWSPSAINAQEPAAPAATADATTTEAPTTDPPAGDPNPSAADLLPANVSAYIELARPQLLSALPVEMLLRSGEGPALARLRQRLESLPAGRLVLAGDVSRRQVVLLVSSEPPEQLAALRGQIESLWSEAAQPGATARAALVDHVTTAGSWVIASAEPQLVADAAARAQAWKPASAEALDTPLVEPPADKASGATPAANAVPMPSLAADSGFQAARRDIAESAEAWVFFRPEVMLDLLLPSTGTAGPRPSWPIIRQLIAGLVRPLSQGPYVAFELRPGPDGQELSLVLPDSLRDSSGYLRLLVAALDDDGLAVKPLLPEHTLLSISAAINPEALEAAMRVLFEPAMVDRLAERSPNAAMFLAGVPLLQDVFKQIQPEIQVVLAARPPAAGDDTGRLPSIPAGAIIFRPRRPDDVRQAFLLSYLGSVRQSNLVAKRSQQPTLVLKSERRGDALVTAAIPREPTADEQPRPLAGSIAPAAVVAGSRFMICTSLELARELADLANAHPQDEPLDSNLRVDVGPNSALAWFAGALPALSQPAASNAAATGGEVLDAAASALGRLAEQLPDGTRELPALRSRMPLRVRLRARFGRYQ